MDTTNRSLSTQLDTIKAKLEVLEDDRNFLVRQLKAAQEKAETARLTESAAAKERENVNENGNNASSATGGNGGIKGLNTVELLKSLRKTITESNDTNQSTSSHYLPPIGDSPRMNIGDEGNDMPLSGKSLLKKKEVEAVQKAMASDRKQLELMAREVQSAGTSCLTFTI